MMNSHSHVMCLCCLLRKDWIDTLYMSVTVARTEAALSDQGAGGSAPPGITTKGACIIA